jgi:hypothetical protein
MRRFWGFDALLPSLYAPVAQLVDAIASKAVVLRVRVSPGALRKVMNSELTIQNFLLLL